MLPHEVLNKQVYIKDTNVRVMVTSIDHSPNKGTECEIEFVDNPTSKCYKTCKSIYGHVNTYKTDAPKEELTGRVSIKNLSKIPFGTKSAKLLYKE